jgi:phage terminase large subunit-like protein
MTHAAEAYVDDILSGRIVSNQYIRLACQRHRRDLTRVGTPGFPYRHDPERAQKVIDFAAKFCRHVEGEWAGKPVDLTPADQFMMWVVFGWVCTERDGGIYPRRFREVYEEKARKQGKTLKLAVLGLYLLDADGEEGARVYCAATKLDQARLLHRVATRMVHKSSSLKRVIKANKDNLHVEDTFSRFEPLGQDSDTLDGLNPSAALVDEYHKHKTNEVKNVLDTGMGTRRQPLLWTITTAGGQRRGPCWDLRTYAVQVMKSAEEGQCINERFASFIYALEDDDDPWEERNWVKANPNLDVSIKMDFLRTQAAKAQHIPAERSKFLQKHLGFWSGEVDAWITERDWNACRVPPFTLDDLAERAGKKRLRCWFGIDLSTRKDLTALVQLIPCKGRLYVRPFFYLPESALGDDGESRNRELYRAWAKTGHLTITPGRSIRYSYVRDRLRDIRDGEKRCRIVEVASDPWNAKDLLDQLEDDDFNCIGVPQNIASMTQPTKEFEVMVAEGKIAHDGHPIMAWMVSNVRISKDQNDNFKPNKQNSAGKIDGVSATLNALARYMARRQTDGSKSPNRVVGFKLETM